MEKDRKCFRMIGGVLVERTVNEVLPALEQNREQVRFKQLTLKIQIQNIYSLLDRFTNVSTGLLDKQIGG